MAPAAPLQIATSSTLIPSAPVTLSQPTPLPGIARTAKPPDAARIAAPPEFDPAPPSMHLPRRLVTRAALAACAVGSQGAWAQCAGTTLAPGAAAAEIVSLTGRGETRRLEAQ